MQFVIIDSDTVVDAGLLKGFASRLDEGHDSIKNSDTSPILQCIVANQAAGVFVQPHQRSPAPWSERNGTQCLLLWKWDVPVHPHPYRHGSWETYGLVEDLEYSWHLRLQGEMIVFAPEVYCLCDDDADPERPGSLGNSGGKTPWEFGRKILKRKMLGLLPNQTARSTQESGLQP